MVVALLGADVRNPDGAVVGTVVRLVVDPGARVATHVAIRSADSTGGKLAPVSDVTEEPDGSLRLGGEVSTLPDYAEVEFVPIDFGDPNHPGGDVPAVAWIWPVDHPDRPWWVESSQTIHAKVEGVSLSTGTPVVVATGEQVGTVAGTLLDPGGQLTHVVVLRASDERPAALPATWLSRIDDAVIVLAVNRRTVEALPEFGP